jgi:hypothetical protein
MIDQTSLGFAFLWLLGVVMFAWAVCIGMRSQR